MKFRISDIPYGNSSRDLTIGEGDFDLESIHHKEVALAISFNRDRDMIRVRFKAGTVLELICDRSLETFDFPVNCEYEVLFKTGADVSEDEHCAIRPLNVPGNQIDIANEVRDSILLSIPIKKLHPKFIDSNNQPTEFIRIFGTGSEEGDGAVPDRWEALKVLKDNQNN